MVVDSSAILAILFNEPERDAFAAGLAEAGVRLMSSVNVLENRSRRRGAQGPPRRTRIRSVASPR